MKRRFHPAMAACLFLYMAGILAGDQQNDGKRSSKMRMTEPMETGMMKQGMKKDDVRKAARKKAREMQPMMEQEERSMPQEPHNGSKPAK